MSREADFGQLEQFFENFQNAHDDFDEFLRKFLLEMALRAIAKIKEKTPVDTGALRNTWAVGNQAVQIGRTNAQPISEFEQAATLESVRVVGNELEITISNAMDYASFVEYGHRLRNGAWRNGFFMMTIGVKRIQREIPERFSKEFAQYMRRNGVS